MAANATQLIRALRADFETLLNLVTGSAAQMATIDQIERSLFRHLLRMGRQLLQLFLTSRVQAELHAPQWGWQRQKLLYHAQKAVGNCLPHVIGGGCANFSRSDWQASATSSVSTYGA